MARKIPQNRPLTPDNRSPPGINTLTISTQETRLNLHFHTGPAHNHPTDYLVIGLFADGALSAAGHTADQACNGAIRDAINQGHAGGGAHRISVLYDLTGLACQRVMLIGCGAAADITPQRYRALCAAAVNALSNAAATSAIIALNDIDCGADPAWRLNTCVQAAADGYYRFNELKSGDHPPPDMQRLGFAGADALADAFTVAVAAAHGSDYAKTLGNRPGNHCTPAHLAEQAQALCQTHAHLSCRVLEQTDIAALGMGALLSVAKGSRQPPKFIVLHYRRGGDAAPIALVGKGITFDSGGISLKPAAAMDEMKYDMGGAAAVLGALAAVAELNLKLNVTGIIPACENLPDGDASKPGDIVTAMNGATIEVLNTDAEGRLVLCDALTYAQQQLNPELIIDLATLTGACIIALGNHRSALYANDDQLADALLAAGDAAADPAWRMPLGAEYHEQLKSPFADLSNIGGREAGSVTAACFLEHFITATPWAHLDIAGTAWRSGKAKGATGRPVPLLVHYLARRAGLVESS